MMAKGVPVINCGCGSPGLSIRLQLRLGGFFQLTTYLLGPQIPKHSYCTRVVIFSLCSIIPFTARYRPPLPFSEGAACILEIILKNIFDTTQGK